jgi:hypothetical protein
MATNTALSSLRRGQPLAASIPSGRSTHLAWVGVYPLDIARETTRELLRNHGQAVPFPTVQVYRIRQFEVDRTLIEQDASIAEPELENKANYFAFGEDDLAEKLRRLGVLVEQLEMPYKSDYPI